MLLIVCFIVLFGSNSATDLVSVIWNDDTRSYRIENGASADKVAFATFDNDINKTGWASLEVHTNGSYDDVQQAYAAGLAEGYISRRLIAMHWHNTFAGYCVQPLSAFCHRLQLYLNDNMQWLVSQVRERANTDPYWHQVELFLNQMSGLLDGYHNSPSIPKYYIDVTDINIMQISGDLEDLTEALRTGRHGRRWLDHGPRLTGAGHCSALIKLLDENRELYVAQDTWNGYNSMLRILKIYNFSYHAVPDSQQVIPGRTMTFSSYPGLLSSGDDFYTISSGLVTIETTIGNSNPSLWQYVKPRASVLEAIRNMVANRLAQSGAEWCSIFEKFNSGTYNNQWMVVDYKKFKPKSPLPTQDLLWVLEQIPGMVVKKDLTSLLKKNSYFSSYNTPYFPAIFNASGCRENVKKFGDWFTYDHTPRANIFRRDHIKVKDVKSMTKLMRYNDYTHDPLSRCNCTPPYSAENAISARNDLNPSSGHYPFAALGHRSHGGTDMKMTSAEMARSLDFIAISSPTYDDLPPFQWSKSDFEKTVSHIGHPDKWTFGPVRTKWGTHDING